MTKFETMDNMNVDFVALSDRELMDMEGGGVGVAIALFMAGYTIGKDIAKRGK
ncbi:bacteriocin [Streptococcus sp. P25B114]|uniref:bacteriocin n=1 Tax=Streptococcus suis TaxID=1307 RepID=UPI003B635676